MDVAQSQVATVATMLSDEIGKKLENVIDRLPGGINVRRLIELSVQIALAAALRGYCGNVPAHKSWPTVKNNGARHQAPCLPAVKKSIQGVVGKIHALTKRSGTWQETTPLVSKVNRPCAAGRTTSK